MFHVCSGDLKSRLNISLSIDRHNINKYVSLIQQLYKLQKYRHKKGPLNTQFPMKNGSSVHVSDILRTHTRTHTT